jgi:hypothetical protein
MIAAASYKTAVKSLRKDEACRRSRKLLLIPKKIRSGIIGDQ